MRDERDRERREDSERCQREMRERERERERYEREMRASICLQSAILTAYIKSKRMAVEVTDSIEQCC